MLVSVHATDADDVRAYAHVVTDHEWISIETRATGEGVRMATLSLSPDAARRLLSELAVALADLGRIKADLAIQRALVSRDTDHEASELEASHASP